jgi:glycosyltransferase involved in cell wall biosynthesis
MTLPRMQTESQLCALFRHAPLSAGCHGFEMTVTQLHNVSQPTTLAFVPWGDVFEDFYGSIGVSFEKYCCEFTGSWHIGFIQALKSQGIATNVYYSSTKVLKPLRRTHSPTAATISVIPVPKLYRSIYNRMTHPHHSFGYWSDVDLFGTSTELGRIWFSGLKSIAPYLATDLHALAREIRRDGCSAILSQDYNHAGFDKCVLLGILLGLPVYAIFQGGTRDWNRIGSFIRPLTMKLCSGFIIGPAAEAERVQVEYGVKPQRIHQISNALDSAIWTSVERAAAREKFGIPADAQVVVWHGRVEVGIKGLDILITAWEQVCRERPGRNLHLAMLGDGQDSWLLRQRIGNLFHQNVTWIDRFVSDRKLIRSFLATGDIYAFPSRHEGMPIAPVEAMAAGLPVVATDASGVRDIFKDGEISGGVVVRIDDLPAFAAALGRVLDDDNLRFTLAARSRERAKAFARETVGEQLRTVLFGDVRRMPSVAAE